MANILFAWELGANFGHLSRDLPVAIALRADGHDVLFAVRDTRVADNLLKREEFPFIQAPLLLEKDRAVPGSYAEILLANGYKSSSLLSALVDAWSVIAQNHQADLVIANHAPTAVLAMRCLGVSVVGTCIGFELPPRSDAPVLFTKGDIAMEQALSAQIDVISTVNTVLASKGKAPIGDLTEIFSEARIVMTTLPELDHYGPRQYKYVGPISMRVDGSYSWPSANMSGIFAYLRRSTPNVENVLQVLSMGDGHSLCVMPDADQETIARFGSPHLTVQREPVNIQETMFKTNLVITYGTGTLQDALLAGKPVLFCPQNNEQLMAGRRLAALGAGLMLPPGCSTNTINDVIRLLYPSSRYATEAQKFAAKYDRISTQTAVDTVVRMVEDVL